MFWWCSQDRSGPGVYIICCTKIWCLYGSQDRSGQVVTLSVVRRYDVSVFRGEIWARCLIVCCTTVYCLYDSQDRSGPGVYIIRWTKVWVSLFSQDRSGPGVVPRARSSGGGGYGSHASVGLHHQPRVHLLMQWHYRHQAIGISGGEVRAIGVLLFETDIFSEKITFVQCDTAVLYFASLSFACCSVDGYQVFPFIDWQKR